MSCGTYTRSCLLLKATAGIYRRGWWVNEGERWHMFHVFFFSLSPSLSLSSFQLFAGPSVREKKTEQHRSRTLIKFPVSLFPPTFLILPHSLILFLYVYSFLFYFTFYFFCILSLLYIPDTIIVYIVCVCVYLAVLNPLTQSS